MLSPEQLQVLEALRPDCWVSVRAVGCYLLGMTAILALGLPGNRGILRKWLVYLRVPLEVLREQGLVERRMEEWGCIKTWEYTITSAGCKALEEQA